MPVEKVVDDTRVEGTTRRNERPEVDLWSLAKGVEDRPLHAKLAQPFVHFVLFWLVNAKQNASNNEHDDESVEAHSF